MFYTGHWAAYPGDDFDGQAFIDALPGQLGDEWTVNKDVVPISRPNVAIESDTVSLDVWIVTDDDGELAVDILAISRCGQLPEE